MMQPPVERSRLYFLVCWFHAIVQERLRYIPLGWAVSYEFSDGDLRVAFDALDSAVSAVSMVGLSWLVLSSCLMSPPPRFRVVTV